MQHAVAPPSVFSPARLGPIELRNRVVKCGTNEGMSRGGLVTEPLIAWHREFAAGGVGMTTLAYCAVSADGRFKQRLTAATGADVREPAWGPFIE